MRHSTAPVSCAIGPLQLTIHVVQNRYAGHAKVALGQDKQKKLPFKNFSPYLEMNLFMLSFRGRKRLLTLSQESVLRFGTQFHPQ